MSLKRTNFDLYCYYRWCFHFLCDLQGTSLFLFILWFIPPATYSCGEHCSSFTCRSHQKCCFFSHRWVGELMFRFYHKLWLYIQFYSDLRKQTKLLFELFRLKTYACVGPEKFFVFFLHPLVLNRLIADICRWLILSVRFRYLPVLYTAIISRKIKHSCTKPR